jgi:hypothetical protein
MLQLKSQIEKVLPVPHVLVWQHSPSIPGNSHVNIIIAALLVYSSASGSGKTVSMRQPKFQAGTLGLQL